MADEKKVWGIHTQDDSLFLQGNVIAIGWNEMGDLSVLAPDRESFRDKYLAVFPDAKKGSVATSSGMLFRFVHEMQIGDYVVFPSKTDRMVNIGVVESEYQYSPDAIEYKQQRSVKWIKHLPRMSFSQGALYESVGATAEEIIENTKDFILKEISRQLKGYDLEEFVADLLQAIGYRITVSPHGGDSGIDITAYKDELPPRILVQVKSQDGDIKETTIQSLKGAMREGDYGLFVTLSNYTKNAKKYLESTPIIRGINGTELVELVLKYYGQLSEKYRKMIPLKMVYIPVTLDTDSN